MKNNRVLDAVKSGKVKMLYLMGEDPLAPEKRVDGTLEALKQVDFLVVQDIALNETAELADVVLPADSFAEADGTFTNMEGRVQRVRKAVQAPGSSLADSKILGMLLQRLGVDTGFKSAEDVFRALCSEVPAYKNMSYEALEKEGSQLIK